MRTSLAVLVLLLTLAAPAAAQTTSTSAVDEAVQGLRSDPVYVDPDAEAALTDAEADDLRSRIERGDAGPVYVAVLPGSAVDEAGGSPDALLSAIRRSLGRAGTYVIVPGTTLRAGSDAVQVRGIATDAVREHRADGLPAILDAIVAGVAQERSGGSGSGSGSGGSDGPGAPGTGGLALLGVIALGGGAFYVARGRRRRREEAAELEEVKDQVRDDLVTLGDGIRELDIDVDLAPPEARPEYERAVSAYDRANTAWTNARSVDDLQPVGAALEEGRWALEATRARLQGHEPPPRTPPCFFDPRHGPSARQVEWAPPGGAPRLVPACEADAQAVDRGLDPGFREVQAGGRQVPYWAAGPAYSPFYAGGMFGGFGGLGFGGGLLGGLMLGELLDGPDVAWGDAGGWGDGGGFGGGDFGGGDFGGGDFGGGDFGGGDFGGGDF
jgi:hypothetical protein